jgi:hypothetical protein
MNPLQFPLPSPWCKSKTIKSSGAILAPSANRVPRGVQLDGQDLFFRHVLLQGGPAPPLTPPGFELGGDPALSMLG